MNNWMHQKYIFLITRSHFKELGFIETEWLEKYRQRREAIVYKHLEDFRSRGETPDKKQLGND